MSRSSVGLWEIYLETYLGITVLIFRTPHLGLLIWPGILGNRQFGVRNRASSQALVFENARSENDLFAFQKILEF